MPLLEKLRSLPRAFPPSGLGPVVAPAAWDIADAGEAPSALAEGSVLAAAALAVRTLQDSVRPHVIVPLTSPPSGKKLLEP